MFTRLSNSWELIKASAAVLRADKELLIFPFVSVILSVLVMITFAIPTLLAGVIDETTTRGNFPISGYIIGFLFYLVSILRHLLRNSALMGAALIRLRGGDPTVADGFRIASSKRRHLWLRADLGHGGHGPAGARGAGGGSSGKIIVGARSAWHGTWPPILVMPVMVVGNVGPGGPVQRSMTLSRRRGASRCG